MSLGYQPPQMPYANSGFNQNGNPWFNVANQFTPRNLHDIIRWARYITLQSPTTTEVIRKQATYPITSFTEETQDQKLKDRYKAIYKSLKLKETLQNIGFDYFTIGSAFISVYLPIHRDLECQTCKTLHNSKSAGWAVFKSYSFTGTCPKCGSSGKLKVIDRRSLNLDDVNIIKWQPEHIMVNHNPITGEKEYFYKIPNAVKQKIQRGDRLFINSIPWGMIEAVRYNQDFKFDKESIYHLENLSMGGTVEGVPVPPMLSLFSLVFYQATLRKANEAIASEYLTPMRVVFPQAQTANSDPVSAMSLRNFKDNMENAISTHKKDKNLFMVAPVPIGYSALGGEGKNLLVSQEIQQAEQQILISLGVSQELLSGTSNWSSSSVGLRMLENTLFSYTTRMVELTNWVMTKICTYINIEKVEVGMVPFKLLDDSNFQAMMQGLVGQGKVSYTTLFEELGIDAKQENDRIREEAVVAAGEQVRTAYETEQAQFLAAKKSGEDFKQDGEYQTAFAKAQQTAEELFQSDESTRRSFMSQLRNEDYAQWLMTSKMLEELRNSQQNQQQTQQNVQAVAQDTNGGGVGSGAAVNPNESPAQQVEQGQVAQQ